MKRKKVKYSNYNYKQKKIDIIKHILIKLEKDGS